jgi:hypothetical protein
MHKIFFSLTVLGIAMVNYFWNRGTELGVPIGIYVALAGIILFLSWESRFEIEISEDCYNQLAYVPMMQMEKC